MQLSDFAGNESVKRCVGAMIADRNIPYAIIIEGDPGSGRKTLAGIIARSAACISSNPPCGSCEACKMKQNPDIAFICPNEKGIITVDAVRKVRSDAYIMPNNSKRRVFIISDAHKMNQQAQNAMLKVIEEPPKQTIFIFICEFAQQLLETVRSRCVELHVSLPDKKQAEKYIIDNYDYNPQDTADAVDRFSGNIGRALCALSGGAGFDKAALEIAIKSFDSELEMLKCFVPYQKDMNALRAITESLIYAYHRALISKKRLKNDPAVSELAGCATCEQLFAAAGACEKALEDFSTVIPITDGALYTANLCTCIRRALGL